jgi:hypothetical protein
MANCIITDEQKVMIRTMIAGRKTPAQIAFELGLRRSTVRMFVKKYMPEYVKEDNSKFNENAHVDGIFNVNACENWLI